MNNRVCQGLRCILETPQHGNSLADTNIMIVKVAQASKGNSWQYIQARIGQFNGCISMDIVSYNLSETPTEKERKKPKSGKSIPHLKPHSSCEHSNKMIQTHFFFTCYYQPFLKNTQFPTQKEDAPIKNKPTNSPQILLKIYILVQSFLNSTEETRCWAQNS